MQIALNNIVPISQARARLTELADEVATDGRPKLFTRNGTGYVALISVGELEELENFRSMAYASNLAALTQDRKSTGLNSPCLMCVSSARPHTSARASLPN